MAINLNQNTDCCETSCDNTTVNTPGPQGATGATGSAGTNGSDGVNGYSVVASTTTIPTSGYFNLFVDQTSWLPVTPTLGGFTVFITGAGHFAVSGKGTSHITLNFLDYPGDPGSPGDDISSGSIVAPAGARGPAGSAASELSQKGQLLTHTTTALSPIDAGSNNQVLKADSTTPTGLVWDGISGSDIAGGIDLSSQVTGTLPIASVGNAGGAVGDLLYWNGSNWVRLPSPTSGQFLTSQGVGNPPAYTTKASLGLASYAAKGRFVCNSGGSQTVTSNWTFNIGSVSHSYAGANHSKVEITFTDSVSIDLPIFAHYVDTINTNNAGATSNADTIKVNITIQSRTTSGVTLSVLNGPANPIFVFYIPN